MASRVLNAYTFSKHQFYEIHPKRDVSQCTYIHAAMSPKFCQFNVLTPSLIILYKCLYLNPPLYDNYIPDYEHLLVLYHLDLLNPKYMKYIKTYLVILKNNL